MVPAVQGDHRLADAPADQFGVGMRVAHAASIDHHDVCGAGQAPDLLCERLDLATAGGRGSCQGRADGWRRRERLGDRERALLTVMFSSVR